MYKNLVIVHVSSWITGDARTFSLLEGEPQAAAVHLLTVLQLLHLLLLLSAALVQFCGSLCTSVSSTSFHSLREAPTPSNLAGSKVGIYTG